MLRSAASAAVTAALGGGGQCSHAAAAAVPIGLLRQWAARQPGTSPQPSTPAAAAAAAGLSTSAAAAAEAAAAAAAGASPANAMALIKQLRAESGAPIADVKSCLEAANWQMEGAMEALRLKGLAAAVKKASRHASEGLVAVGQESPHCVAVVEVNSETDFVGRSEPFQQLIKAAAGAALRLAPASASSGGVHALNLQQLSDAPLSGSSGNSSSSVAEACASLAGKVREHIALRRGWLVSSGPHGVVSSYVHMPVTPGAGRIAAVVALEAAGSSQALPQDTLQQLSELAAQLAMHSAGMNTQHVSAASMPADVLAAVRADVASQTEALMQGKPPAVLAKAVEGKVAKWLKESCLLDQRFVLDDSQTVAQLLKAKAQQLGLPGALEVTGLLRAHVGEGLERADGDRPAFADEVAAMAGTGK